MLVSVANDAASMGLANIKSTEGGDELIAICPVCRDENGIVDDDLEQMSREALVAEVRRLRAGVRTHRDSTGRRLCWHHPALWSLLPEEGRAEPVVPEWPQFLRGCIQYRASLDEQLPTAPRSSAEFGS